MQCMKSILTTVSPNTSEPLYIKDEISDSQILELIHYANTDLLIQKFTSDPKRFKDRDAYNNWFAKGKSIYILTDKSEALLGFLWLSKEAIPDQQFTQSFPKEKYGITAGLRMYGKARGKGLAFDFMKEAFAAFKLTEFYQSIERKGVWFETSFDNIPAVKLYEKFGFIKVTNPDEHGKILMILPL